MKKGSVTVYLCLVLCVFVSLIYTVLDSARYSCGRALVSLAAEEGLFSLFGEYDRILYEDYGLLVLDGGYGESGLKAGVLLEEAAAYMEKNVMPKNAAGGLLSSDLFRIDMDEKAVTGYVLATDSSCEPIRQQIHALMIQKTGADVLKTLYEKYTGASAVLSGTETDDENKLERLKAEYEAKKREARDKKEEEAQAADTSEGEAAVQVNSDVENPIGNILRLKRLGIFGLTIPEGKGVSGYRLNLPSFPSKRRQNTGMGVLPESGYTWTDRYLLSKYIVDYFPCFTENNGESFLYQTEYAIAGKGSDAENLRSVLTRLLLIREGLNLTYLASDAEKQAQAYAAAAVIAAAFWIPECTELVKGILLLCWAFGESMLDIRCLLDGGKVPVLKDAASWHLSLEDLAGLSVKTSVSNAQNGLDYQEYLCLLLMMKGGNTLMSAVADLLEYNRRAKGGEESFSLDTCVCGLKIQVSGCIGSHDYTVTKEYGYYVS